MKYPYIQYADKKLRALCVEKLEEKYEEHEIDAAKKRLEWELDIIEKYGASSAWLTVYNALKTVNANKEDYCFRGTISALIISFLLDFTDINPITCQPKLYPEFVLNDNTERLISFEANVSPNLRKKLIEFFDEYSNKEAVSRRFFEEGSQYGVYIGDGLRKDYYGNSFEDRPSDVFYFAFLEVDRERVQNTIRKGVPFEKLKPVTYEDNVKCYGLSHGTGVWEDNAELLIEKKNVSLGEVIAYREDVYEMLLKLGMVQQMAFIIAEYVRKGQVKKRGWQPEMLEVIEQINVPEWFIDSCAKVVYLFPRAHGMNFFDKYWK